MDLNELALAWLGRGLELLLQIAPATAIAVGTAVAVVVAKRLLLARTSSSLGETGKFLRQLAVAMIAASGLIAFVVALPIAGAMRVQLLSLLGLVVSAAIALSSTTLVGNAMAGLMLRFVGRFGIGDFIEVDGHLGRVTQRGLLHIEIQTEDSDLETLPNSYLVTHPLKVVRESGTIVSATVSLGYDVPRTKVNELVCQAVADAELTDGFSQIIELGDYSITYRAAGFLANPKTLISSRSRLRGCMIDALHLGGVEIVSPSFMNQRPLEPGRRILPSQIFGSEPETSPEEVIFAKAEAAASLDELNTEREALVAHRKELKDLLDDASGDEAESFSDELSAIETRLSQIAAEIDVSGEGEPA